MSLTQSNRKAFDRALAFGRPDFFARAFTSMHRSASARQQQALFDALRDVPAEMKTSIVELQCGTLIALEDASGRKVFRFGREVLPGSMSPSVFGRSRSF